MTLEEIKQEALLFQPIDEEELANKVLDLKNKGVSFLGCVAFVQLNQNITLVEAREKTLALKSWSTPEKASIEASLKLMMSEYEQES